MGWTYDHKDSDVKVVDFFKERFFYENENSKGEVIAGGVKNFHTAYMAYKITDKKTNKSQVVALVCLISYNRHDYHNFGFKDMDESCGPNESNCPEKIMKLLTPTDNVYAIRWRERCWDNINKRKEKLKLKKSLDK